MNICVITGTRADYGLLQPLMELLASAPDVTLQVLVTGMHLAPEFGDTWKIIQQDGFHIDSKVEMLLSSDTPIGVGKSTGLALMGCVEELSRLAPDWVVVLGDRYEIFAAATACVFLKIPVAHFHGGESTEGAFDECFRHSVTKMAYLHFTATEDYRRRVIQLGEDPARVFALGAPALDAIEKMALMDKDTFSASIGFSLAEKNALVTYHPETLSDSDPIVHFEQLLTALNEFPNLGLIFTYPNSDTGGRALITRLESFIEENSHRACGHISLGQSRYYSALAHVDLVIGNSSSGLIEAPAFGIPTVNIGKRQAGRSKGPSVISCASEQHAIASAIRSALNADFAKALTPHESPYGHAGASKQAFQLLMECAKPDMAKRFYDINHKC